MDKRLERILPKVQKPARYTGGEYNQIMKDRAKVDLRLAFCFPDTYEIGMSNLGMKILYHTMNNLEYVWCERVFAPWSDMWIWPGFRSEVLTGRNCSRLFSQEDLPE